MRQQSEEGRVWKKLGVLEVKIARLETKMNFIAAASGMAVMIVSGLAIWLMSVVLEHVK